MSYTETRRKKPKSQRLVSVTTVFECTLPIEYYEDYVRDVREYEETDGFDGTENQFLEWIEGCTETEAWIWDMNLLTGDTLESITIKFEGDSQ